MEDLKNQKINSKENKNLNGMKWNSILKQLKLINNVSKRKICNIRLQFSGQEVNHCEPKQYDKAKICNESLQFSGRERKVKKKMTNDNCPLKERLKVRTRPNPVMEEVGNERKEEEIQSQHLKEENQKSKSPKEEIQSPKPNPKRENKHSESQNSLAMSANALQMKAEAVKREKNKVSKNSRNIKNTQKLT